MLCSIVCRLLLIGALLTLGACVAPYVVQPTTAHFAPATAARIIENDPPAGCVTVATFRGNESRACPTDEPYCALRKVARAYGADTVWIERVDHASYEGEWKLIRGRLVHLRPFTTTTDVGRFLRCENTGLPR
jgi:hypothetical protein